MSSLSPSSSSSVSSVYLLSSPDSLLFVSSWLSRCLPAAIGPLHLILNITNPQCLHYHNALVFVDSLTSPTSLVAIYGIDNARRFRQAIGEDQQYHEPRLVRLDDESKQFTQPGDPVDAYREYDVTYFTSVPLARSPVVAMINKLVDPRKCVYYAIIAGPHVQYIHDRHTEFSRSPSSRGVCASLISIPCWQLALPDSAPPFAMDFAITRCEDTGRIFFESKGAIFYIARLPAGDPAIVQRIVDLWKYSGPESFRRIKRLTEQQITMGIFATPHTIDETGGDKEQLIRRLHSFTSVGLLVGWALVQDYGAIGMLETVAQYRGRGFAKYLIQAVCNEYRTQRSNSKFTQLFSAMRAIDERSPFDVSHYERPNAAECPNAEASNFSPRSPFCYIVPENSSSFKVFHSLGFVTTNRTDWTRWTAKAGDDAAKQGKEYHETDSFNR